jgi:hypothetical protein
MVVLVRAADHGHSKMVDAAVMLTAVITALFVVMGIFLSDLLPFRSNSICKSQSFPEIATTSGTMSERYG